MYHPLAMDLIRVQADERSRRTATAHWTQADTPASPRRSWRPSWPWGPRRRRALALASVDC